jgi:hypothetical protein
MKNRKLKLALIFFMIHFGLIVSGSFFKVRGLTSLGSGLLIAGFVAAALAAALLILVVLPKNADAK